MSMSITSFLNSAMYIKNLKFPVKLHKMLCDPSLSDIMIWTPCGQAWKILDTGELFEKVAAQSKYFNSSTPSGIRYRSFMRQVSYWGFTKIKSGKYKDCYFNKFFKRDSPHLLSEMKRGPNRSKKETRNNTPKQEAGKQVVVQNVSSPDGVTTHTTDNGQAFSSSTNLKKNRCIAAPVIYEQKKESNEGTGKDENKASTYQKWCKQRYSRLVNQEHVDEKLDVVKPSGSEREREMKEKETHQQEEQKQKTQIAMTPEPDFISSSNFISRSSSDSDSDTPKIYQLFKELQEREQKKEEGQETQKAHFLSMNTQNETSSSMSRSRVEKVLVPVSFTNEGQQEFLRKSEAQSTLSSSSGYGGFNLVNSMGLNSSLLLPPQQQQDHQLPLHNMQTLSEMSLRNNNLLREEVRMEFLQQVQQIQLQKQMEYHEAMVRLSHLEQMARFQY